MIRATTTVRVPFIELDDFYIEFCHCEPCSEYVGGPTYPDVFRFEIDGEVWLTDRYWLLPAPLVALPGDLTARDLPAKSQAGPVAWIEHLRTGELNESASEFSPTFAGVLTMAGFEAFDCGVQGRPIPPHALVCDGERVGLLMPTREPTLHTSPLPCSLPMLAWQKRLTDAGGLSISETWRLAAFLSKTVTA